MSLKRLISNYADYNLSANQQLVNWLSQKTDEQLKQEVPSSFSSLVKTLNHIWGMEAYWFAIITETNEFEQRYGLEDLDAEEVFTGIINRSTLLAEKIKSYTEAELEERIKVVSPWVDTEQSRADYLQHLFNHSTYHRGQVVTIGRNVGLTDAPSTDYLFFNALNAEN